MANGKNRTKVVTSNKNAAISLSLGMVFLILGTGTLISYITGGPLFDDLRNGIRGLFGILSFPFTLLILWLGVRLSVQAYHPVSWRGYLCISAIMIILAAAVDLFSGTGRQPYVSYIIENSLLDQSVLVSWFSVCGTAYRQGMTLGNGTGFVGMLAAYPLHTLLTDIPAGLLCLIGDTVLVFVLFRTNPMKLFDRLSDLTEARRQKRFDREQTEQDRAAREEQARAAAEAVNARRQISSQNPAYASPAPMSAPQTTDFYDVPAESVPPSDMPVDLPDPLYPEQNGTYDPSPLPAEESQSYVSRHSRKAPEPAPVNRGPVSVKKAPADVPAAASSVPAGTEKPVRENAPLPRERGFTLPNAAPAPAQPSASHREEPAPETDGYFDVEPEQIVSRTAPESPAKQAPVRSEKPEPAPAAKASPAFVHPEPARPKQEDRVSSPAQETQKDDPDKLSDTDASWLELVRSRQTRVSGGRMASSDRPKEVNTDPVMPLTGEVIPITPRDPVKTGDPARRGMDGHEHQAPQGLQISMNLPLEYAPPPIDLLSRPPVAAQNTQAEDQARAQCIVDTLESFKIPSEIRQIMHGPAITRFAIQIGAGIKVSSVISVQDNIGLQLGTKQVRVEAPIQGTNYIGIEAPNSKVTPVTLREVLESDAMRSASNPLVAALGKDIAGTPILCDLSKMPHLLIAGATGSGKSVCINSIVCSLIYRAAPQDVRLIMVDPKQVELQTYNGIPHLLVPVISDPRKAAAVLNWVVNEMFDRYHKFSELKTRNIAGYNKLKEGTEEKLPNIVVIIDEMADLMDVCRKDVEESIRRLAALARAAGIYMVLATQRPSVDVITGVIKNNIPSRIAFAVSSAIDSRTILDMGGAEKLVGKGDMLYKPTGQSPTRVQGCFLSDDEVNSITDYVSSRYETNYDPNIQEELDNAHEHDSDEEEADDVPVSSGDSQSFDDLLEEAILMAIEDEQISTSMIQRRLRVGYARAGRLIDEMEKRGIISKSEGSKPRKTLVSREEYLRMVKESGE